MRITAGGMFTTRNSLWNAPCILRYRDHGGVDRGGVLEVLDGLTFSFGGVGGGHARQRRSRAVPPPTPPPFGNAVFVVERGTVGCLLPLPRVGGGICPAPRSPMWRMTPPLTQEAVRFHRSKRTRLVVWARRPTVDAVMSPAGQSNGHARCPDHRGTVEHPGSPPKKVGGAGHEASGTPSRLPDGAVPQERGALLSPTW